MVRLSVRAATRGSSADEHELPQAPKVKGKNEAKGKQKRERERNCIPFAERVLFFSSRRSTYHLHLLPRVVLVVVAVNLRYQEELEK